MVGLLCDNRITRPQGTDDREVKEGLEGSLAEYKAGMAALADCEGKWARGHHLVYLLLPLSLAPGGDVPSMEI